MGWAFAQPFEAVSVFEPIHWPSFFNYRRKTASTKRVSTKGEMDAKTVLGRFVRKLREQANLTQEQLARKTGITYQYLSGLENGRENFSIVDVLESLAE